MAAAYGHTNELEDHQPRILTSSFDNSYMCQSGTFVCVVQERRRSTVRLSELNSSEGTTAGFRAASKSRFYETSRTKGGGMIALCIAEESYRVRLNRSGALGISAARFVNTIRPGEDHR